MKNGILRLESGIQVPLTKNQWKPVAGIRILKLGNPESHEDCLKLPYLGGYEIVNI